MSIKTKIQPRIVGSDLNATKSTFRGGPEEPYFGEAASQTYKAGDLIYLDSSGNVAIATVDGNANLSSAVAGLADAAASGVTAAAVHFPVIREDTLVEMSVYSTTPTSAELVKTMIAGKVYGIIKVSGVWCVDLDTTAESATVKIARVKIIRFVDAVGDRYGRVIVKFIDETHETDGGSFQRNLQL